MAVSGVADTEKWAWREGGEAKTHDGQVVFFMAGPGMRDEVKDFLAKKVASLDVPRTKEVNVTHGGYGRYSRYDIQQHKYAGGGSGYIEVLEIRNPPDGRCGIVIFEHGGKYRDVFTEWKTLEDALAAWEGNWSGGDTTDAFAEREGFIRRVPCGIMSPWFYATGDQALVGDYAFPEGLQDDSVYVLGKYFVVFDNDGVPAIKRCMGCRWISREERQSYSYSSTTHRSYRVVFWDDGTAWDESGKEYHYAGKFPPRPLEDGEVWAAEALQKFKALLAGGNVGFDIKFADGSKFVGRLVPPKKRRHSPEGDYYVRVHYAGKRKSQEGWINDFTPSSESPDIVQYVLNKIKEREQKEVAIRMVEVVKTKTKPGGKKWRGVYHIPASCA